jgi:hypothetical protein
MSIFAQIANNNAVLVAAFGAMYLTIMGGIIHVVFQSGRTSQKVDNLERSVEEIRRHVFPVRDRDG